MRYSKSIFYLLLTASLVIIAAMLWNGFNLYKFETKRVNDEIDFIVKETSEKLFHENVTLLNNVAIMLNDDQYSEKMAFAAGFTQNMASIGVSFDEDTIAEKEAARGALEVDKQYLLENNIKYDTTHIKQLTDFDTLFNSHLIEDGLNIDYIIRRMVRNDTTIPPGHFASRAFIINATDPKIYRVLYTIDTTVILKRMVPYIATSFLLVLLFVLGSLFYMNSYKLQQQMTQFKESLFSNVAHELKTPISSLQLILDAVHDDANGDKALISKEHVQFAHSELNRMKQNVDKILSLGKLSKAHFELNKELLNIKTIVSEAVSSMNVLLTEKKAALQFQSEDGVQVLGDKALLVNTFITVIDNALKYNSKIPAISISVSKDISYVYVRITDNGIGIPETYSKKIFDPFFRVPTGSRHEVKGHGLGLSFAAQVVNLHNGKIEVSSEEGKGSSFLISIPAV